MTADELKADLAVEFDALRQLVNELEALRSDVAGREPTVRERTAAAAFLAQFYSGLENILKRLSRFHDVELPLHQPFEGFRVLMLPLGIAYFVTAVTALAVGLSFMLLPIAGIAQRAGWWVPWESAGHITFNPAWLDTPPGWVVSVAIGVIVSTTLMHLARGVVGVHARAAKALLVTPGA